MTSCLVFVFACLLENAVVNVLVRMERRDMSNKLVKMEEGNSDGQEGNSKVKVINIFVLLFSLNW